MSSSKIVMVLALLFLGSFALPWFSAADGSMAGYQAVQLALQLPDAAVIGYMLLVGVAGAALLVILGAMGKGHGLVAFFSSLSVLLVAVASYFGNKDRTDAESALSFISVGAWIALGAALLLFVFSFTKSESKLRPPMR